jgi:hypothetical protein
MPTFYSYTAQELQGSGSLASIYLGTFSANIPYVFHIMNNLGAAYFTLETVRNENQVYDSASQKTTQEIIYPTQNIANLVKSEYIAGFALSTGENKFVYYPTTDIDGSKVYLRGTGDITLLIEETAVANEVWNNVSSNWESDSDLYWEF